MNANLNNAKKAKNDEFYTQLSDIQSELNNYIDKFKNKIVFCNCDDPFESNFVKFFLLNFNRFGLKELIASGFRINGSDECFVLRVKETKKYLKGTQKDLNAEGVKELLSTNKDNILIKSNDNGDFRSEESLKLLEESDIVVTNPPFSLFREFIKLLIDNNKNFLVIGSKNSVTYKEVFPLIKSNKLWLGFNSVNNFMQLNGDIKKFGNICWFTNIDITKRHDEIILYKQYKSEDYPHYVNYNAINVDKVSEIPCDYNGIIGVPVTFLDKYNPEQFEIIGNSIEQCKKMSDIAEKGTYMPGGVRPYIEVASGPYKYKRLYDRIFIKNKNENNLKQMVKIIL